MNLPQIDDSDRGALAFMVGYLLIVAAAWLFAPVLGLLAVGLSLAVYGYRRL